MEHFNSWPDAEHRMFDGAQFEEAVVWTHTSQASQTSSPPSSFLIQEDPDTQEPGIEYSDEQLEVLDMILDGQNVFFTGSAGTGKSVLLRKIIRVCKRAYEQHGFRDVSLAITASTGLAAVNIGGGTLHSWAGIGLGKEPLGELIQNFLGEKEWKRRKKKAWKDPEKREMFIKAGIVFNREDQKEESIPDESHTPQEERLQKGETIRVQGHPGLVSRWKGVKTLIIDEISMIEGALFDKLEFIARVLRETDAPFGGIHAGDFLQLPPVNIGAQRVLYAFQASTWSRCIDKPVFLTKVFRQKDPEFVDMLNNIRKGRLDPQTAQRIQSLARPVIYNDNIEPCDLFPTREEAKRCNENRLRELPTDPHVFEATDVLAYNREKQRLYTHYEVSAALDSLPVRGLIELKIGAQVMLVKVDVDLNDRGYPLISFQNLVPQVLVNGSMGRVQGFMSGPEAQINGIKLAITEQKEAKSRNQNAPRTSQESKETERLWPVVEFEGGHIRLCVPETFDINDHEGRVQATRHQIPLNLAWALSIHKSQGQTIPRVRINLERVFANGQAYVALSRATSMDTLQVTNFHPKKVSANQYVLEWMRQQQSLT